MDRSTKHAYFFNEHSGASTWISPKGKRVSPHSFPSLLTLSPSPLTVDGSPFTSSPRPSSWLTLHPDPLTLRPSSLTAQFFLSPAPFLPPPLSGDAWLWSRV
eukprot:1273113-Rhodomonas_salina.1